MQRIPESRTDWESISAKKFEGKENDGNECLVETEYMSVMYLKVESRKMKSDTCKQLEDEKQQQRNNAKRWEERKGSGYNNIGSSLNVRSYKNNIHAYK